MGSLPENNIRRIAVVGAGPAGLAMARYLLAEGCFERIDVYERQATVEGVWKFTIPDPVGGTVVPQTNPFQPLPRPFWRDSTSGSSEPTFLTPMYDQLETNIPYPLMEFSDLSFPTGTQLCPSRQSISQYLEQYASGIRNLIKFSTQVIRISLQSIGRDEWHLKSEDLLTGQVTESVYDAIALCNGHYEVSYIPNLPGLSEWNGKYPGTISHSKTYRTKDAFCGKKVLIIGNSASGTDIASQISKVSAHPLLVSQRSESFLAVAGTSHPDICIKPVDQIAEFLDPLKKNRAVRFVDGQIEDGIDSVLFATGYLYSFPFLQAPELDVIDDGIRVKHVYQHLFHIDHPSLVFPGLPVRISPFPVCEAQSAVVARVWSGRLTLPPREEMIEWEKATLEERGEGRAFHNLTFPRDYNYQRLLCDWASQARPDGGKLPFQWSDKQAWVRERFPAIKQAFAKRGNERHSILTMEELGFDFEEWEREQKAIENQA